MELSKIGQYFVQRHIAEGGQAKIYQASNGQCSCAIKVYHSEKEKENHLFSQEKELMSTLNHKVIFSPLEYRANETILLANNQTLTKNVVIMKYMKNGDLMNYVIKNGRIDERVALRLIRRIVECLEYLSSQNVYHCDVKPQNILLDQHYEPLLIDFGFITSKLSIGQKEYPKQYYIAPEVKKGQPYTEKSQAFSFGVLIFILAVGCLPFKHTKHTDPSYRSLLQGKHQIFWKQFQQNLNHPLNQKLKQAIVNLMQPNPKRRWGYSQLKHSEWFDEDLISQKQYFRYFEEKSVERTKKESHCQFPFTDNEQTASKDMMEENM